LVRVFTANLPVDNQPFYSVKYNTAFPSGKAQ